MSEIYEDEIASDLVEPVQNSISAIERANIDIQIATAHTYPRSLAVFKNRATEMVSMDEETAQSCIYRRPVGKKNGKVVYAEGKSIRMAEIVGCCYGNLRVVSMIIEQTERFVRCRGMAHDLESNFAASSEVIESTLTSEGNPYSERMRIVVAKACLSKARRDAIFQVVPVALCKTIEDVARQTAIGTVKTLEQRRALLEDWINKLGIDPLRVYQSLGIKGIEDIGLAELETLTGIRTAIKDGDVSVEEAFPREAIQMPKKKEKSEPTGEGNVVPVSAEELFHQQEPNFATKIEALKAKIPPAEYDALLKRYGISDLRGLKVQSAKESFRVELEKTVASFNQ